MRISIDTNDPGFAQLGLLLDSKPKRIAALLDGLKVSQLITADEEMGFVKFYVVDARGGKVKDEAGNYKTHVAYGDVKIEIN